MFLPGEWEHPIHGGEHTVETTSRDHTVIVFELYIAIAIFC